MADSIERLETIKHLKERLVETALNNVGFHEDIYLDMADHRIETWVNEVPSAQPDIIHCKDCKHWMPYDWMFSEVWRSINMDDYSEDEIGCAYCDMNMSANDFCSRGKGEKMNKGKNVILTNDDSFEIGEYIVYVNGDRYELGRIKSLRVDGAFVYYHEGDTAAKTPYNRMHKLVNGYCIKESTLGGATMMKQEENNG